ncbi:MAG: DoxX family protein [Prevotella sp.]|nr:DoxX family protein [Prevotella sp.]
MKWIVNICRLVVALTFIFSGFVKAIDPLGTQYKIDDYLGALGLLSYVPEWVTLGASVALSALEFSLGVLLLFAIHRRVVSRTITVFMVVMTIVTLWLWIANPVEDCGCFGDAVKLTNGETLIKNVVLLTCSAVVAWRPLTMVRFISRSHQWIIMNLTVLSVLALSGWSLYDLPLFDFRPYHVGANILESMKIPEGAPQPKYETTFILSKNGEEREFTLDNYPDSTWTFVDSRSTLIDKGYEPPIHDFSIETLDGEDVTDSILQRRGYTFLLIAPSLSDANSKNFGKLNLLAEYARQFDYGFCCLTASNKADISKWQQETGADYKFYHTDGTTLKTVIRSNPGLLLIKDATIMRKWSRNRMPEVPVKDDEWIPLQKAEW